MKYKIHSLQPARARVVAWPHLTLAGSLSVVIISFISILLSGHFAAPDVEVQ